MAKKQPFLSKLKMILPDRMLAEAADQLNEEQAQELVSFLNRPNVSLYADRRQVPYGLNVSTEYGSIHLDPSLRFVDKVYVNDVAYTPTQGDIAVMETLLGDRPIDAILPEPTNGRRTKARRRPRRNSSTQENEVPFEKIQERAQEDLSKARLSYETFFTEFSGIFSGRSFDISDIMQDLRTNEVAPKDFAHYLVYESPYKREIVSSLYGVNYGTNQLDYQFETVHADDSFLGRLMQRLEVTEAEYDRENGVLKVGERLITNLPNVDENGVFSNRNVRYLPYHIGYFAEGEGSRVERLRHIDPVEKALNAVELQYRLSEGDIKFKSLLDVTRNLPDFDNHPYGQEILDTLKRKVVLDTSYSQTNSLVAEHQNRTDDLGAVAMTMLDDDAKGLIDPLGTSNGSNMGRVFYLTEDAQFNPDGTFTKGTSEHSKVGHVMKQFHIDKDNFNRHQMSFNAFLTSTGVYTMNVAYAEFALWNSEDAVVLTDKGAAKLGAKTGDKVIDMHGNKSVSSLIIDSQMSDEQAKEERLNHAVTFAKLNPDVDMIVSPVSLASRLNMGVAMEGLANESKDLHLPNGETIANGVTQITYMTLPQTAEHKSKDYGKEGNGRKYSTLFHHALASKIGEDLYREAIVKEEVRQQHIDEIGATFDRLGVSFKDESQLLTRGNIQDNVPDRVTVKASDYKFFSPAVIRLSLSNQMEDNAINIDLGNMSLTSPLTGKPMQDASGRNVLPLRVAEGEILPYRYAEVFKQLAMGNQDKLQLAYNHAVAVDYKQLTTKDNLLKHIDTMTFFDGAKTEMIAPDPRLKLGQIATAVDCDRVIAHRDPCVQSGNVISMENVGGKEPNLTHINPLMVVQVDGDFDSDTMGINAYDNLAIDDQQKDTLFAHSSVYEQLNRYGEVFLATGGSHFKAAVLANQFDDQAITFADGKSNEALAKEVESLNAKIVDSAQSYGSYALSFANEQTLKESLGRLADDGIKGNREDMERHFDSGYTVDENRALMKALIAKSEWTGLAGSTTNRLIAGFGGRAFDADLTRVAMDVTYSMTQSVLQLKKNADRLVEIDDKITRMKVLMDGSKSIEDTRTELLEITKGLTPPESVERFVDLVADRQAKAGFQNQPFGTGVLHSTGSSNNAFAFMSESTFVRQLRSQMEGIDQGVLSVATPTPTGDVRTSQTGETDLLTEEELKDILNEFEQGGMTYGL